jgi:hypothetical protein
MDEAAPDAISPILTMFGWCSVSWNRNARYHPQISVAECPRQIGKRVTELVYQLRPGLQFMIDR